MTRLILLLLFLPLLCFGQLTSEQEKTIDSLKHVIETAAHDTIKINTLFEWNKIIHKINPNFSIELMKKIAYRCQEILNNPEITPQKEEKVFYQRSLSKSYHNIGVIYQGKNDFEKAIKYYMLCLPIREKHGDRPGMAKTLNNMGVIYHRIGEYGKAAGYYNQSIRIREELGDKSGIANPLNNLGSIYSVQGDFAKAIELFTYSLQIRKELGDKTGMANPLNNLGNIYNRQGHYAKAINYYVRSLQIREELKDTSGIAGSLNNIGNIYKQQGNYSKAIDYYNRSILLKEELGDKSGMASTIHNVGEIFYLQDDNNKAMEYFTRSLIIYEELGQKKQLANTLAGIGILYKEDGNYLKAMEYYDRSLQTKKEIGEKVGMSSIFNNIGELHFDQKLYNKAINYNQKALKLAKEIGAISDLKDACESLYKSYKKTGSHRLALQMYEHYIAARDSLESENNQKEIIRQEFKYQYEKQVLADSIQNAELQKVKDAELAAERAINQQQQQRSWFLLSGLLVALFFGGFIFKQKKQVEAEKEKSENLLLNILPENTAEELKEKGRVAAKSFDSASILFSDFKAFVAISGQMTPEQLVKEVDECFSAFDEIMAKYGIEKIKTIGDAYMAAGGVPTPNNTHASDTLKAALEIQTFMHQYARERKRINQTYFEARIGIHTGPVVAGVVGKKKFQYDLWGDTVNIASRMESAGEVGKVNISEATYELVKNSEGFSFTSRGHMEVKGKGVMSMYFVNKTS